MSEAKFTKGKWRVERFVNDKGFEIAFNDDGELVTDYVYEESDANLIVAAPEMYEEIERDLESLYHFVKTLAEYSNDWLFYTNEIKRKEYLLAKARGGQSD